MTAKDYAAMYRHVITRLRANGVTNAVNVIAYMGNEKWMAQSWWKDLYPGDAYVDWIGLDSYVSVEKGYYHYGDMGDILDRQPTGGGLGWYDWAVKNHPKKPIMVAEWGMYHRTKSITDKALAVQHRGARAQGAPGGQGDRLLRHRQGRRGRPGHLGELDGQQPGSIQEGRVGPDVQGDHRQVSLIHPRKPGRSAFAG
nr:hypothetical protein GCM10020092_008940 [Actinoplanes digitatis]